MIRTTLILAAVCTPFMLGLSAPTACTQDQVDSTITASLDTACGIVADVQKSTIMLNAIQTTAVNAFQSFCPPNPAPTTVTNTLTDALLAVPVLIQLEQQLNPAKAAVARAKYHKIMSMMAKP